LQKSSLQLQMVTHGASLSERKKNASVWRNPHGNQHFFVKFHDQKKKDG